MVLSGLKRFHFISGFDYCVWSSEKKRKKWQPIVCSCLKTSGFFHHFTNVWTSRVYTERKVERVSYLYNMHSSSSCASVHITWESNLACIYVVAPPSLYKEMKMKFNFFFQKKGKLYAFWSSKGSCPCIFHSLMCASVMLRTPNGKFRFLSSSFFYLFFGGFFFPRQREMEERHLTLLLASRATCKCLFPAEQREKELKREKVFSFY